MIEFIPRINGTVNFPLIARAFPNVKHAPHFLCGLSMGGYGTLRLGAINPDRYTALSAHSGITDLGDLQTFTLKGTNPFSLDEGLPLDI